MNLYFLVLVVFFWAVAEFSVYAVYRRYEYSITGNLFTGDMRDLGDLIFGLAIAIVGLIFGVILKLLFGAWGARAIYTGQAVICFTLGAVMLYLGFVFA